MDRPAMIRQALDYTPRGYVRRVLTWSVAYELSMAVTTALLAWTAKHLTDPNQLVYALVGFAFVAQLPNLIEIGLRYAERPGYHDAFRAYLEDRLLARTGQIGAWATRGQRERFLTAIGPEAENSLSLLISNWIDTISFSLNILFTTAVLAYFVDADFGWAFALSLLLGYLTYRAFQNKLQTLVHAEQQAKFEYFGFISQAWDNVLLNNRPVHRRFADRLQVLFANSRRRAASETLLSLISIAAISLAASVPIFALNIYLAWKNPTQIGLVAALTVTLPRQLSVITTFRNLFVQITNLRNGATRFRAALDASRLDTLEVLSVVDMNKILIDGQFVENASMVRQRIQASPSGRILISGENGAGKSSLLIWLNRELPNSFYLPAAPALDIGVDYHGRSTGQVVLAHLEFAASEHVAVLLLDEWDANLDAANVSRVSARLDELARTRVVVEVRHRVART